MDATWGAFSAIIGVLGVGTWLLFRSLRKWKQPRHGSDPEAEAAEARLWSTLNNPRT